MGRACGRRCCETIKGAKNMRKRIVAALLAAVLALGLAAPALAAGTG